jgi:hypothetical protein
MLTFLNHAASYSSMLMALLSSVVIYRGQKHKAKGIRDPWRPYLYTVMIAAAIVATAGFILQTSHR